MERAGPTEMRVTTVSTALTSNIILKLFCSLKIEEGKETYNRPDTDFASFPDINFLLENKQTKVVFGVNQRVFNGFTMQSIHRGNNPVGLSI